MRFIIDGCDGVGKTVICNKLRDELSLSVVHLDERINDYEAFRGLATVDNIIFDRQIISEWIYAQVYNRESKISFEDIRIFVDWYKKLGGKIIFIESDIDLIKSRIRARGEFMSTLSIKKVIELYRLVADELNIPIMNNVDCTVDMIVKKVKNYED